MAKKKGKYADVIGDLPREFGVEPERRDKVNALKTQILTMDSAGDLNDEAIEELIFEVQALLQVINDNLVRGVANRVTAINVAKTFKMVRVLKEVMSKQESITNTIVDAYTEILVDQYEVEGVRSVDLEDGGKIRWEEQPHAKVVDKDANRKWAIANGMESALSIHWNVLNAIAKDLLLKGEELPDGVEMTARPKVVYTKG
jgi:hypothetical protein